MADISGELQEWIQFTLGLGLEAYGKEQRTNSIFLENTSGEQHTIVMDIGEDEFDPDEFLEDAQESLNEFSSLKKYAIVWIGTIELEDGEPMDAVIVAAGHRDEPAVTMAQPFRRTKSGGVAPDGELVEVSREDDVSDGEEDISEDDNGRLNELVSAVISTAFERLQAGNETPFACLARDGEEAFDVHEPGIDEGEFEDFVDDLRDMVASDEDAQQYAIGYMGNAEAEDGKIVQGVYVEAGDLNGQAPIYFVRYTTSKSGKIQPADEVELYAEGESLWVGNESNSDDDDDENVSDEPDAGANELDNLVQQVFFMAVDRLKGGNSKPCACIAYSADDPLSVLDPGDTKASDTEILEAIRQHVATLNGRRMYAIVYYPVLRTGGKEIDAIVVEAGVRGGEAPVFALPYERSKSGKIKHEEIEFLRMADNLWQ